MIQQVRESYRRNNGEVRSEDCRKNLSKLASFGEKRTVIDAKGVEHKNVLCFVTEELANIIGRNTQVLYRWRTDEKWPETILTTKYGPQQVHVGVYTEAEVRAMVEVFGEHQTRTPYYHGTSHAETREKLFDAIAAVRKKGVL